MSEDDRSATQAEREAMCPDEGYAVVATDDSSHPGDAPSRRGRDDSLAEIDVPSDTEFTGYAVSDTGGVAHGQEDVRDRRPAARSERHAGVAWGGEHTAVGVSRPVQ